MRRTIAGFCRRGLLVKLNAAPKTRKAATPTPFHEPTSLYITPLSPWEGHLSQLNPVDDKKDSVDTTCTLGERIEKLFQSSETRDIDASPQKDSDVNVLKSTLNWEQQLVLEMALDGASLFIAGKAGTGKSYLLREISAALSSKKLNIAVTGSTGVASLNIGGNTFHSTLGVPVLGAGKNVTTVLNEASPTASKPLSFNGNLMSVVDVIIIDEISLLHAGYLESLDRSARSCEGRDKDRFFGGIQVILSGDFLQLTPFDGGTDKENTLVCTRVEPKDGKEENSLEKTNSPLYHHSVTPMVTTLEKKPLREYFSLPMYESYCFKTALLHVQLHEPSRQQGDTKFLQELNDLRCGKLPYRISRSASINPFNEDAIRLFTVKHAVKTYNDTKMMFLQGAPVTFQSDITLHSIAAAEEEQCFSDILVLFIQPRKSNKKHKSRVTTRGVSEFLFKNGLVPKSRAKQMLCYLLPKTVVCFTPIPRVAIRFCGRTSEEVNGLLKEMTRRIQHWIAEHGDMAAILTAGAEKITVHKKTPSVPSFSVLKYEVLTSKELIRKVQKPMQKESHYIMKKDFILQNKTLKVGCRVMLLRNLNHRLVNGAIGTVERFLPLSKCGPLLPSDIRGTLSPACARVYRRIHGVQRDQTVIHDGSLSYEEDGTGSTNALSRDPVVPIVVMDNGGDRVAIPWVSLPLPGALHDGFFCGRVNCMPLTPAYAFTVHKIQGLTLSGPLLFDAKDCFPCHHLVYVAASRVKSFSQLRIINLSPSHISVHIPSLQFSESVPDARSVYTVWKKWRSGKGEVPHKTVELPSWVVRK